MSNRTTGTYSEATVAAAVTAIDDLIDAAFSIGTPTELVVNLTMSITTSTNVWTYSMSITARAYHASTVNTTLKANLAALITEWEDIVTDSGKYSTVATVKGNISITAIE